MGPPAAAPAEEWPPGSVPTVAPDVVRAPPRAGSAGAVPPAGANGHQPAPAPPVAPGPETAPVGHEAAAAATAAAPVAAPPVGSAPAAAVASAPAGARDGGPAAARNGGPGGGGAGREAATAVATRYCPTCAERVPAAADGEHCARGHRLSPAHAKPRRRWFRRNRG